MARTVNRWLLASIVVVLAVELALFLVIAHTGSSSPSRSVPKNDPVARRELAAAFAASDRLDYRVDSRFVRTLAGGRRLSSVITEVNRSPEHLTAAFGAVDGVIDGRVISCSTKGTERTCTSPRAATPADGVAATVASIEQLTGRAHPFYVVRRAPSRRVLGEQAYCYELVWTGAARIQPWGRRSEYCFGRDGLPLRTELERNDGSTDVRVARKASRSVTDADFHELLAPFDNAAIGLPPGASISSAP